MKNYYDELEVNKKGNDVIFSVKDYAGGLPKEVQDKLFKEMERIMKLNLKETGRTVEEELNSRCQDAKKA